MRILYYIHQLAYGEKKFEPHESQTWAQSYQCQLPENFLFSELKILFVIEATILLVKTEKISDPNYFKIQKTMF